MNHFSECPLFQERLYCYELYLLPVAYVAPNLIGEIIINRGFSFAFYNYSSNQVLFAKTIGENSTNEDSDPDETKYVFSFNDITRMLRVEPQYAGLSLNNFISFMEALEYVG